MTDFFIWGNANGGNANEFPLQMRHVIARRRMFLTSETNALFKIHESWQRVILSTNYTHIIHILHISKIDFPVSK